MISMLSPVKSTKIYEIVIEQIKEIVKRGELRVEINYHLREIYARSLRLAEHLLEKH